MTKKLEIYPSKVKSYERELRKLKENNERNSQRNLELIKQFHEYLFSTGSGELRVAKLSSQLRRICQVLGKNLDKVEKQDLVRLIAYYNRIETYSEETKSDYRRCIKQFYNWYKEYDPRLESVDTREIIQTGKIYRFIEKEVKTSCKIKSLDYSNILDDETINQVVTRGCRTFKEKAFIKFIHETGCRAGEVLNLKICDIEFKDTHALVLVDGKTGPRRVFIVHSVPLLQKWLEIHPEKFPTNHVWIGENPRHKHEPLLHKGAQKLINRCFERAGLEHKRHNLHWFRHSRATLLSTEFTETTLCDYMGWTKGSKQIRRYVHLGAKQVENAFLEHNGLIKKEDVSHRPTVCSCGTTNDNGSKYCYKCGKPLSVNIALQDELKVKDETNKTVEFMMEMMKNPEMMKKFEEFMKG